MSNQTVVLIHGMGNHSAPKPDSNQRGSFGKECIDTFNTALQMYPSLQGSGIEDKVNFVEIHYNHLFDTFREEMAKNGQTFKDLLGGAGASSALGGVSGLVQAVINFEASLDGDDVLFTHWLDVILYKLYFGEIVRLHVAKRLGDIITRSNTRDIHILAHSLGTAVAHDSLSKIYSGDYADNDEVADLSPVTHKLASVWQIANVSRMANSVLEISNPYKSVVKPGATGVAATMMNIHHKLDPFTLAKKFSRPDNGKWIPKAVFNRAYNDIETTAITQINTHSITQYLHDPQVHLNLFNQLGIAMPPEAEIDNAMESYRGLIIDGAVNQLKDKFAGIKKSNSATFVEFYELAGQLVEAIKDREV